MESKKSRDANLERSRIPLFFIGVAIAGAVILTAFEWKTFQPIYSSLNTSINIADLPDEPIFTVANIEKPKPPPKREPTTSFITTIDDPITISIDLIDLGDIDDEPDVTDIPMIDEGDDLDQVLEGFEVDAMPEFPGGEEAMMDYLHRSIRYPNEAIKRKIQGTVWIEFIVAKDGTVQDVNLIRGIGGGCDEEGLRVVQSMPAWMPGKQRGIPVHVRYRIPIRFTLR